MTLLRLVVILIENFPKPETFVISAQDWRGGKRAIIAQAAAHNAFGSGKKYAVSERTSEPSGRPAAYSADRIIEGIGRDRSGASLPGRNTGNDEEQNANPSSLRSARPIDPPQLSCIGNIYTVSVYICNATCRCHACIYTQRAPTST
ncbi:hypothetical protein DBV15_01624 [Temnothorax longispinosus]|uniref:Uncharacterized protein n=1 Tax=Temnothorax longispinosus TaxID=300112 RepID=A0A4S2KT37_9HYME|nr:hypothetical protein DBV15_01624 [Temnothorax longispinosus]